MEAKQPNPDNCTKCNIKTSKSSSFACTKCKNFNCQKHTYWLLPSDKKELHPFCAKCYQEVNPLDMAKTFDIYGPEDGLPIVLLHGGLGNRIQWKPQIVELSKYYRLYVPDLPGHGARFEEAVTLDSAVKVIAELIETQIPTKKALIMGYSLGAYILMHFISKRPELCSAAIIGGAAMDGQGFIPKMSLKFMGFLGDMLSPITMSNLVLKAGTKAGVSIEYIDEFRSTGATSNFHHQDEINTILLYPNFAKDIASYDGPILFIHGEKEDARNGEELFLKSAKHGKQIIIKGANHLLTHIPKFNEEFVKHLLEYAESVGWKKTTSSKTE